MRLTSEAKQRAACTSNLTTRCGVCGSTHNVAVVCPTCEFVSARPRAHAARDADPGPTPSDVDAHELPAELPTEIAPEPSEPPEPQKPPESSLPRSPRRPRPRTPADATRTAPRTEGNEGRERRADRLLVLIGDACGSLRTCGAMLCAIAIAEKARGATAQEVQREARRLRELAEAIETVMNDEGDAPAGDS